MLIGQTLPSATIAISLRYRANFTLVPDIFWISFNTAALLAQRQFSACNPVIWGRMRSAPKRLCRPIS